MRDYYLIRVLLHDRPRRERKASPSALRFLEIRNERTMGRVPCTRILVAISLRSNQLDCSLETMPCRDIDYASVGRKIVDSFGIPKLHLTRLIRRINEIRLLGS